MAYELDPHLPPTPPEVLDATGAPRYGTFLGALDRVDLTRRIGPGLFGKVRHFLAHKHWIYATVATDEVLAAFAIVDIGYASNAFAFAVDLRDGKRLADVSFLGVPGMSTRIANRAGSGAHASFVAPGAALRVTRAEGTSAYQLEVSTKALQLEALLETAGGPPPLAAVLPTNGGDVNVTQKANLLAATGTLRADGRRYSLGGGYGGFDYTQGLLPRKTQWRWAFALGRTADGLPVGLNLTDGLSDAAKNEHALWIGHEVISVGPPRFTYDAKNPLGHWAVRTADGAVDLRFSPKAEHREDRNLGLVVSHFLQVAGTFEGLVKDRAGRTLEVKDLPGVTEDQRVVW